MCGLAGQAADFMDTGVIQNFGQSHRFVAVLRSYVEVAFRGARAHTLEALIQICVVLAS